MDKAPLFVGIDVAKHRLDVHLRPSGESFAIDHGEEEVTALVEFCSSGPRGADVDRVETSEEEPEGLSGFEVR